MNWYLKALKQYTVFRGRARRKEYWFFLLFQVLFLIIAALLDTVLGINFQGKRFGPLYIVVAIVQILPGLAVSVRRLHDVGKSGWFLLLNLIPIIGGFWLLILVCRDSMPGENQYGPNPKA